jgi:Ala-tRNA(Pro) deacylase
MVGKFQLAALARIPQEITMSLAHRLRRYLESEGIGYETLEHPRTLTSSRSAQAAHVSGELLVKSVILHHELGYVVAVAPSTHRVELDTLQGLLNQRLALATENEIAELFDDCEIGAIPPVGAAYGLAVIIDESVAHLADVYFEGGDHATLVRVTGGAFRRSMKDARPFRFSRHA